MSGEIGKVKEGTNVPDLVTIDVYNESLKSFSLCLLPKICSKI